MVNTTTSVNLKNGGNCGWTGQGAFYLGGNSDMVQKFSRDDAITIAKTILDKARSDELELGADLGVGSSNDVGMMRLHIEAQSAKLDEMAKKLELSAKSIAELNTMQVSYINDLMRLRKKYDEFQEKYDHTNDKHTAELAELAELREYRDLYESLPVVLVNGEAKPLASGDEW